MILSSPFWSDILANRTLVLVGFILLLPGAIDGTTQMFGERESNNLLRAITGALLGFGVVIFLYGVVYSLASQFF